MKSVLFTLLLGCLFSINLPAQDWTTAKTFAQPQTLNDIYAVNDSTVYAVSALYNGTALNIKKTTDGGLTWVEQYSGFTRTNFRQIASPNHGVDVFVIGGAGHLLHSSNGGTTWDSISIGIGTTQIRDISFLSDSIGYIAADRATILKTTDGGMSWTNINAVMSGVGTIGRIRFLNENRGFIAGFNFFKETFDGGANWTNVPGHAPAPGKLFQIQEIQFLDSLIGYISGDVGLLYRTSDGGATWIDLKVSIPGLAVVESLMSFKFLESDPNIGFACGYHGLLIRTYDGGESWETMTSDIPGTNTPQGSTFPSLDFSGNKGFMTGQHGKVLTFEYTSSVSIDKADLRGNKIILYPNPVNGQLYFSGINAPVEEIQLMDLNGKILKSITNPIAQKIDCHDLNPGTYIFKIISSKGMQTKLFVKR